MSSYVSPTLRRAAGAPLLVVLLASCASDSSRNLPTMSPTESAQAVNQISSAPVDASSEPTFTADTREEIVERGDGRFFGTTTERPATVAAGDVNLRFANTDLQEFAQAVLGDLLGLNYVIDPNVSGTVTIQTSVPIPQSQVLPLFEQVLAMNGATLVISDNLYRVSALNAVPRDAPLTTGAGTTAGYRTQVIPLRYIAADEMRKILDTVAVDSASVSIDTARNLIFASGSARQIDAILEAVNIFDVDWLRGMSIGLYPLDNVSPTTLEGELRRVLGATTGQGDGEILGGIVRLVPLERLTSLLVVSSTAAALREVEIWIRRLDQPGESAGQRLYVYPVQNAKATELADILGSIFQSRSSRGRSAAPLDATGDLAPGLQPLELRSRAAARQPLAPPPLVNPAAAPPPAAAAADEGLEISDGSNIEIIADDVRNALVILASPQDYRMVESALRKLDIVPLQVMIEASILEVVLRDDLTYGVEWFFRNTIDGGDKDTAGALDLGSAGIAALAPGFSYTVIDSAEQVRLALNALATESQVNVLSSPSLMVLDNQTATINVGDEIPVPARQAISNLDPVSPTVNEISFRQTGVTLSVTPRVNSSGLVTMEIRQEVATAAATTTSNIDAPTIQNRAIESTVAINSGDTIILGGLMQDQTSQSESGIPGLRRIPGLGKLFSRTADENTRTELLVLITPRVVRNRDDARAITEEFRQKLPQLQRPAAAGAEPKS
jgi:general secretion pathway protein D